MSTKINILLLSQYFTPEPGAGSSRAYEHAVRWVKEGAQVTVLTCFPNYPNGVIPEKYRGMKYHEEIIDGIKVIRTFTFATPNKGFFRRSVAYFSFMVSSVIQSYKKIGRPDVIIASSPPFTVGLSGLALGKLKKIPFIFEVRDLWPESIVQLGQIKNKLVIKLLEYLEVLMYRNAVKIVGVSSPFVEFISNKGIPADKIDIIKNGVDLNLFKPVAVNFKLRTELGLDDKFIVSYFGTFGLAHALDKVLLAAELLKDIPEIHILLIGDGAEREKLERLKEELRLDNVTILNPVQKEELIKFYSISNVMLATLRNLPLFESALPSKMFEIFAMERAILTTVDGEARRLIEKEKLGAFVTPEEPQLMADKIIELSESEDWVIEAGRNARKYVEKNFDRDILASNYLNLLLKNQFINKNGHWENSG